MLVWGGYTGVRPKPPAEGAAYNPKTRRWRTLASSPLNYANGATSVWADGRWVIAIARDRTEGIEVVAYDPDRDRWQQLPRLHGQLSEENQLVWTGSELLLINLAAGMLRLAPDASAWIPSATPPLWGQVVWTADRLLGVASTNPGPLLVGWDPAADAWSEIPSPSSLAGLDLIWTGDRAVFPGSGLAFDPLALTWWDVQPPPEFDRSDSVVLWAGDRLLMLGGWPGGPSGPIHFGEAWIPDW
jgi:hypothetical protein